MSTPRFLFIAREPGNSQPAGYLWRLIWSNNRELGRGALNHPTFSACRQSVDQLRENYGHAVTKLIVDEATGHFTWRLEVDEAVVATRGREYMRERECRASLRTFLSAVPIAEVADHAVAMQTRAVRR